MVSSFTLLAVVAMAGVAMGVEHCICPLLFAPVCASNGQTYSNKCLVRCHNKETNDNLKVVHFGNCAQKVPSVELAEMVPRACICTMIYAPVCASNGKTFPSVCSMNCHNAQNNEHLTVVSEGPCTPFTKLIEKFENRDEDLCPCTREYNPVCGSDHQIYANKCLLKCAARKNHYLTVVSDDNCDSKPILIQKVENQDEDLCPCTMEYSPVCGSDNQIYANKCLLKCAAKKNHYLTVASDDNCNSKPTLIQKLENQDEDLCPCTKEYKPVCGSNLHTYANKCLLECAAKKDKNLHMLYPMLCIILP